MDTFYSLRLSTDLLASVLPRSTLGRMQKLTYIAGLSISILVFPALALAATTCVNDPQGGLNSPLLYCNIQEFVETALKALVMIALPIIAFFIVVAGFRFVTAQGNPENLKKAKMNFLYVIIGAGLILGAWVLSTLIGATVSQLVG